MTPDEIKAKVQEQWPTYEVDDVFIADADTAVMVFTNSNAEIHMYGYVCAAAAVDECVEEDWCDEVLGILDTTTGEWLSGTIKGTPREITLP